ncbi:uncharacterized protein ACMZJ9_015371 [Mantella aurantiaca]
MESIALTGRRRMSAVHGTATYGAMERDEKSHMTERMLNLTLEIIYLLTGEKFAAVKMTCIEGLLQGMYPPVAEGWDRSQTSIAVTSAHSSILDRNHMQKIGEITNKLIDLLTGEVPIRRQDVTDCISRKDHNLEGHKDVMMEKRPPLTSPDGSSNRNPPERCPRPLYSRDSTPEGLTIPHHHQVDGNPKERCPRPLYSRDSTQEPHEIPQEDQVDGSSNRKPPERCPRPLYSRDSTLEDLTIPHNDQGLDQIDIKVEIKEEEEEMFVVEDHLFKVEDLSEIGLDGINVKRSSIGCPVLPSASDTDEDNSQESFKIHPAYRCADGSPNPRKPEEFSPCNSHSPAQNIHQGLHSVAGSPDSSYPEELYTNRSHAVSSNTHPRLDEGDGLSDLSNPEGSVLGKPDSRSQISEVSNITPDPLIPYRPPDPSKAEETSSCDKTQATSPHVIPGLHIGYRPPGASNPEESPFIAMTQQAETHEDAFYPCYSSLVKMVEHQRTHGGDQPSQEPASGDHQRRHLGKKVFPCVECEKFFAHSADLDKHRLRHSREKPFSCSECGKSYTQKSHLVNHQRLHTGENILPCAECGRCFTLKSQFIKHMRTHTGEKPYCCSECGRCFAQKSTLDNHRTIHTGQKPFTCFQCGKHFARKSTLQKHLELHASGFFAVKSHP